MTEHTFSGELLELYLQVKPLVQFVVIMVVLGLAWRVMDWMS